MYNVTSSLIPGFSPHGYTLIRACIYIELFHPLTFCGFKGHYICMHVWTRKSLGINLLCINPVSPSPPHKTMAIATLAVCYNNPNVFSGVVKIRKGQAVALMMDSTNMTQLQSIMARFAEEVYTYTYDTE